MADIELFAPPRKKRFTYQSYEKSLQDVHLPSATLTTLFDEELPDDASHFHNHLAHLRQMSLGPTFLNYSNRVFSLSQSMPLLVLNWKMIGEFWVEAIEATRVSKEGGESYKPLLELLKAYIHDLRSTILPLYNSFLKTLLSLLRLKLDTTALAELMATILSLLKYVFAPNLTSLSLRETWHELEITLHQSKDEIRRALGEVLGAVLRRMKGEDRTKLIKLMINSSKKEETHRLRDGITWSLVHACQAPSRTLHASTSQILLDLLDVHLSSSPTTETASNGSTSERAPFVTESESGVLIRRLLSSFAHHVADASSYEPASVPVLDTFVKEVGAAELGRIDLNRLIDMFRVMEIPILVRKGARMQASHLSRILDVLSRMPANVISDLKEEYANLTLAVLSSSSSEIMVWLANNLGKRVMEKVWEHPAVGLRLTGALAEVEWDGWKAVVLPELVKHFPLALASPGPSSDIALTTLAYLVENNYLDIKVTSNGSEWWDGIAEWVKGALRNWRCDEQNVARLMAMASIVGTLPVAHHDAVANLLINVIDSTLTSSEFDYHSNFLESPLNEAFAVATSLTTLLHLIGDATHSPILAKLDRWFEVITSSWTWSADVLQALAKVCVRTEYRSIIQQEVLFGRLHPCISSHFSSRRRAALQLLAFNAQSQQVTGSEFISPTLPLLQSAIAADEVPLDISTAPERVFRVKRVAAMIRDDSNILDVQLVSRWLLAQLKVNLRPLWGPVVEGFISLMERFQGTLWTISFDELKLVSNLIAGKQCFSDHVPGWSQSLKDQNAKNTESIVQEQEKTWGDPAAHRLVTARDRWSRHLIPAMTIKLPVTYWTFDRLDQKNYETQILAVLAQSPSIIGKYSRDFSPFFLSVVRSRETPRPRLKSYMTVMAKLTNPKVLYSSPELHSFYLSVVSTPDRSLQCLALDCILGYKSPAISPYGDRLRHVLDETKWSDELLFINIDKDVESEHRAEFVHLLISILFGILVERKGRNSRGGNDRAVAVFGVLSFCTSVELRTLVDLMLQPFHVPSESTRAGPFEFLGVGDANFSQQLGFLNLLGDLLRYMGVRIMDQWPVLLRTALEILHRAQCHLPLEAHIADTGEDEHLDAAPGKTEPAASKDSDSPDTQEEETPQDSLRSLRSLRQTGLKRFKDFFVIANGEFDFTPYMSSAFESFISPRIPKFDQENTQSPSALLELITTFAESPATVRFLTDYDSEVLPKVFQCINSPSVKPSVISKVFDLVDEVIAHSAADPDIAQAVLIPNVSCLLEQLAVMIERYSKGRVKTDALAQRQAILLSSLSAFVHKSDHADRLLRLILPLLRKPFKSVPEKLKLHLLQIVERLVQLTPACNSLDNDVAKATFQCLSALFQSLKLRAARAALLVAFRRICDGDSSLVSSFNVVDALNSYSRGKIDVPDFERRLEAFSNLNEDLHHSLSHRGWVPIVYNLLFFIQDVDELSIRANASLGLRRFIDRVLNEVNGDNGNQFTQLFTDLLYPSSRRLIRSKSELVRVEVLKIVGYSVEKLTMIPFLGELRPLLAGRDGEANFFHNIHHIQLHRRTRALRRLADCCRNIRASTLAGFFLPLVSQGLAAGLDQTLVHESIVTVGRLSCELAWGPYLRLVQSHLKAARVADELQKGAQRIHVRTLNAILDNFSFELEEVTDDADGAACEDAEIEEIEENPSHMPQHNQPSLVVKIADAVTDRLLPRLLDFLENREETEDGLRFLIVVGVVRVCLRLPEAARQIQISRLVTILSQALRSRSQDTRKLVRETLCRISTMLGSNMLPTVLKELQTALVRGPHLHVLAFVAHALLVHVTTPEHVQSFGNLDPCTEPVARIASEVIFGQSARDPQSEGTQITFREVRGTATRGPDMFSIMAKHISSSKIRALLDPVRSLLHETESAKMLHKVDEVLGSIASGLNGNVHLTSQDILSLCHTLITQNAGFLRGNGSIYPGKKRKKKDVDVELKRDAEAAKDIYSNNAHKFVAFGLDLFITAIRRGRFDLKDPDILSRLDPMVEVVNTTLHSAHSTVLIPSLRASAAILRYPLRSVPDHMQDYVRQVLSITKKGGSTESEVVQTALRSLATIMRYCPGSTFQDQDLSFLLELVAPDLEEKDRQDAVFAILRAIVSRKFVVPEMYDVMDKTAEVMVTSQSQHAQELCRKIFWQFLLDYPQGEQRLKRTMTSLAKNLSYTFESGRISVLQFLRSIFPEIQESLLQKYSDLFFLALVMLLANDDSSKCREMAAGVLTIFLKRLDNVQLKSMGDHLRKWIHKMDQPPLVRTVAQIYGIIADVPELVTAFGVGFIIDDLNALLVTSSSALGTYETKKDEKDESADAVALNLDWRLPYQALMSLTKTIRPDHAPSDTRILSQNTAVHWNKVADHLLFPHTWVRLASARLLGMLFSASPIGSPSPSLPASHPLSRDGSVKVARKLCIQLRSPHLDDELSLQVVKNLFHLGRCFSTWPESKSKLTIPESHAEVEDGEDGVKEGDEVVVADEFSRDDVTTVNDPLPWLFSKLSFQARSAQIARRNRTIVEDSWARHISSVFKWFAAMANFLPAHLLEKFLLHILNPLYRVLDDDIIRDPKMDELKTLGQELQTLVQEKVGTTKFAPVYNDIRQGILNIRQERKAARVLQTTADPIAAGRRRVQRNLVKKNYRKRKNQEDRTEKIRRGLKRTRYEY